MNRVRRPAIQAIARLSVGLVLLAGCGRPPQVGANNYELIAGLRTAISARRADWLDKTERAVVARRADGELDEQQTSAFQSIIETARGGQWDEAESQVMRLAKAQSATGDDRVPARKPRPGPSKSGPAR